MTDRFEAISLFIRVARTRSFSVAARERGISQPTVSRAIAGLEKELGVALLARTPRAVTLTDVGADYFARVEVALNALNEATDVVRGSSVLSGTLRIGTSSSFAQRVLIPRLPRFLAPHSELRMNLLLEDQRQDLIAQGIDVALRFGVLEDSCAVARRIHSWPRVAAASPDYISRAGEPQSPADLANFQVFAGPAGNGAGVTLRMGEQISSVKVDSRFAFSTSEGRISAAVAGMGIVVTTLGSCAQELSEGALVRVLEEWDLGEVELHAVYAVGRQAKPAARALTEFLITEFATNPLEIRSQA
ncbi:MAG TPA: LysR substrate-binding domain-containing protein [Steroidobacteraceae bacterium]|jgi:DNA-binding transcriptional LysR family regulator